MTIDWQPPLVDAIGRRRSVLLIGSGVSANAVDEAGKSPPTWGNFLESAYSKLGRRIPHIRNALVRYDYLAACEFLRGEHAAAWPHLIKEAFASPRFQPAPIHRAIFDLDSRVVVSLNFDRIYDNFAIAESEGTVIVKQYFSEEIRQVVSGPDRYVLKPHGDVDTIGRMIFTLSDYGAARIEHASFYEILSALLHTHTFLCIGCGLSDPDMQLIFEDYRYKYSESPHYILLPSPVSQAERQLIHRTRGLNVITYSSRDGHRELTEALFDLRVKVDEAREVIAEKQSW